MRKIVSGLLALVVVGCGGGSGVTGSGRPPVPAAALGSFDGKALLGDIVMLASDSFQGRLPGTPGEERTVQYLEAQFKALGLEPGNPDGSYIQKVPLVGITPDPSTTLVITKGAARRTLKFRDDVVAWTKHVADQAAIANSEMVFVGYGVEAPEFQWDDFKGFDATGKTLVMLVNDPPLADTTQFGGKAMTYYGRWTYKYEQGMRHKAAAVLIVHETGPSGYPFVVVQGKTGEQFDLVTPGKNMERSSIEGWISLEQAKAIFAMAGQNFDSLKARAATRQAAPVPLGLSASMTIHNTLRTVDSRNVVARLPGSDAKLKDEYVVYDAHWDHFGIGAKVKGDSIYNGAVDNASGTGALLALARAFKAMPTPPKRSILFLAVTGEEQGLIGSQYYSVMPLYPLARTLADINIDGLNVAGRTRDVTVIGIGASELDDYIRDAAAGQNRVLRPDPEPEKGYYYRSDHFNFAKQGVPALYIEGGVDYFGRPADFGIKSREKYVAEDYHKPSDEVRPDWVLDGAIEDLKLLLTVGYWVAEAPVFPAWRPGNEFRAAREKQLGRYASADGELGGVDDAGGGASVHQDPDVVALGIDRDHEEVGAERWKPVRHADDGFAVGEPDGDLLGPDQAQVPGGGLSRFVVSRVSGKILHEKQGLQVVELDLVDPGFVDSKVELRFAGVDVQGGALERPAVPESGHDRVGRHGALVVQTPCPPGHSPRGAAVVAGQSIQVFVEKRDAEALRVGRDRRSGGWSRANCPGSGVRRLLRRFASGAG